MFGCGLLIGFKFLKFPFLSLLDSRDESDFNQVEFHSYFQTPFIINFIILVILFMPFYFPQISHQFQKVPLLSTSLTVSICSHYKYPL
jgi:hypothetical protein